MSDTEEDQEGRVETRYRCRHCPGKEFTAAGRDEHRQKHKKKRTRGASPPLTLFEPITVHGDEEEESPPENQKKTPKKPRGEPSGGRRGRSRQIVSNKVFKPAVKTINDGG